MNTNPSTAKRLWLTLLLGTISATGPLSIDLYLPALPEMSTFLNVPASLIQMSLSSCLLGLALGQIIAGPLSDKYGRKKPLLIGFAIFGITSLFISFSTSAYMLIGLRFVQGLAGASGQVLSRAIARDLFAGPLLTKFYAMLSAVNGIFPVISPVIGGFLVKYTGWKGIFILLAIIGLVVVLAIFVGLPETLPEDARITSSATSTITNTFKLLTDRGFLRLIILAGLIYGALFSYISASSFVFQTEFHMSVQNFSLLYALNGIGIALGSALPGRLSKNHSILSQTWFAFAGAGILSLILLASSFLWHNLFLVIGLVFLIVIFIGMLLTTITSIIMNSNSSNAGGTSALMGVFQNAVSSLMSPVVGLMGTHTYTPMAAALVFCCGAGLSLLKRVHYNH